MMAISYTIDGIELNGVDGRRLHGQIINSRTGSGIRDLSVAGILTGTTTADLQDKWAALKLICNVRDKKITVKIDSTTTNFYEEIFPGDGTTQRTVTFISADESRLGSATTLPFVVTTVADENIPQVATGGSGNVTRYQGQVGDWRLTTTYSEARVESRAFIAQFSTVFDKEAYGPFTINSVEDVGGKARFVLATTPPSFKSGQRIYISGSTLYNGVHDITAVDTGTKKVTTATNYSGSDTGAAIVGEATTPQENYTAVRDSILTERLGTGAGGIRNATTGLVLVGESVGLENDTYTVILNSTWIEKSYNDNIKNISISVSLMEQNDWPNDPSAGAPPKMMNATVTFSVDRVAAGNDNPYSMWNSVRAEVIGDIKSNAGLGDAVGPLDESVTFDKKAGMVTVTMTFLATNITVFRFSRVFHTHEELQYTAWKDSEGYDIVQTAAEPLMKIVSVSVSRVGVGEVSLDVPPPTEPGYTYIEISKDLNLENPIIRRNLSDNVVTQSQTKAWRRFKFRSGSANPRVRNPVT